MKKNSGIRFIDRRFLGNVLLIGGIVFAFLLFCGFVGVTEILSKDTFATGVFIDDVNVSGLSYEDGEKLVREHSTQQLSDIQLTLNTNGEVQQLSATELGISYGVDEALKQAYEYNKHPEDSVEQRFNKTAYLSNGVNFYSEQIVDQKQLRSAVMNYAKQYSVPAIEATATFNKNTATFDYMSEQTGTEVDTDKLMIDIMNAVTQQGSTSIQVAFREVQPSIKADELKQNTSLLSTCVTIADNSEYRNTNIKLISAAVDGYEIKPGTVLSINELVGERTAEKGYMPASAISDGILVDQVGGGICQLAGTLYNAALLADLEIVERVKHTWPSVYLPIGQDSTLNWNDKDLKIKNNTDYSIFVSAKFVDQNLTVKLFGQPLPDGMTIEVKNNVIKEIDPGPVEILYTSKLAAGTTQTVRKARTGYKVEVYRIYYQDGVEVKRTLVSKDTYPALSKIVLKGRESSRDK